MPVAVEVAGAGDVPIRRNDGVGIGAVGREATWPRAQPVRQLARVAPPQHIAPAITTEVVWRMPKDKLDSAFGRLTCDKRTSKRRSKCQSA